MKFRDDKWLRGWHCGIWQRETSNGSETFPRALEGTGLGCLFSIKDLCVCIITVILFLREEYPVDNDRRLLGPRQNTHCKICNTGFAMCTHTSTHTSSPFGKYFVLSTLVSQPLEVAGPSAFFPLLFLNGYQADETFQSNQIVDSYLQTHLWPQSSTFYNTSKATTELCPDRKSHKSIPQLFPDFKPFIIHRNKAWCLLLASGCVYCGRVFDRPGYCSLRYHSKRKAASSWAEPTSLFEQVPAQTLLCTNTVYCLRPVVSH